MIGKIDKILVVMNNFILSNKHNQDIYFTIAYFNDDIHFLTKITNVNYINKPIITDDLTHFGGFTSLYDAVCKIINDFSNFYNIHHKLFIITDGEDNSSKHYNKNYTENLCDHFIKQGNWTIIHFHTNDVEGLCNISEDVDIEMEDDKLENIFKNLEI
jgi:hypothetical protein